MDYRKLLVLTVTITVLVTACSGVSADPCYGRTDSTECNLYRSQLQATLEANDRDRARQAQSAEAERVVASTQQAVQVTRAAEEALAQASATSEAFRVQSRIAEANAQATLVQATIVAQREESYATSTAVANISTLEAGRLLGTATAQAILDESNRKHLQAQADAQTAFWDQFVNNVLKLIAGVAVTLLVFLGIIHFGRALLRMFREWSIIKARSVNMGGGKIVLVDNLNRVIHDLSLLVSPNTPMESADGIPGNLSPDLMEFLLLIKRYAERASVYKELARRGIYSKDSASTNDNPRLQATNTPELSSPSVPLQLPQAPPFNQLVREGYKPTLDRMILSYDSNGPVYGKLTDMLSVTIAGRQNMGKTTYLRWVASQAILVGAQVVLWDIHSDVADEMTHQAILALTEIDTVASSTAEVIKELDRRIKQHARHEQPVLVMADETNTLIGAVPEVIQAITRLVYEGRKYRMFCMLSTKGVPASLFRDSTVRDSFAGHVVYQTSRRAATMLGFDGEVLDQYPPYKLLPTYALSDIGGQARLIQVPLTTTDDLRTLVSPTYPTAYTPTYPAYNNSPVSENVSGDESDGTKQEPLDLARRDQVRTMLRQRLPSSQIIREVWGVTGGPPYVKAARELSAIVSTLVQ